MSEGKRNLDGWFIARVCCASAGAGAGLATAAVEARVISGFGVMLIFLVLYWALNITSVKEKNDGY